METILNEIKTRVPNREILCLYRTGSALFCDNCRDTDIVAICDSEGIWSKFFKLQSLNTDIICLSKENALNEASGHRKTRGLAYALATGDNLLYGKLPFDDYSWDKYKKSVLKEEYKALRRGLAIARIKGVCSKDMTWAFATYYAYTNGNLNFTAKQRETLQQCHDLKLPVSYAEELKNNMENLLKE